MMNSSVDHTTTLDELEQHITRALNSPKLTFHGYALAQDFLQGGGKLDTNRVPIALILSHHLGILSPVPEETLVASMIILQGNFNPSNTLRMIGILFDEFEGTVQERTALEKFRDKVNLLMNPANPIWDDVDKAPERLEHLSSSMSDTLRIFRDNEMALEGDKYFVYRPFNHSNMLDDLGLNPNAWLGRIAYSTLVFIALHAWGEGVKYENDAAKRCNENMKRHITEVYGSATFHRIVDFACQIHASPQRLSLFTAAFPTLEWEGIIRTIQNCDEYNLDWALAIME